MFQSCLEKSPPARRGICQESFETKTQGRERGRGGKGREGEGGCVARASLFLSFLWWVSRNHVFFLCVMSGPLFPFIFLHRRMLPISPSSTNASSSQSGKKERKEEKEEKKEGKEGKEGKERKEGRKRRKRRKR